MSIFFKKIKNLIRLKFPKLDRQKIIEKSMIILLKYKHSLRTFISDTEVTSKNMTISLLNRDRKELKVLGNKILNQINQKLIKKHNIELIESKVEAGSGSLPTQNIESYAISTSVIPAWKQYRAIVLLPGQWSLARIRRGSWSVFCDEG